LIIRARPLTYPSVLFVAEGPATDRLRTNRPEIVAWMARRYRGIRPDSTDEVLAT
jgi:hypothetical protein